MDKPQASCLASAEIYIVGFKYKALAKIDPQLLDVKHHFQGGKESPKVIQSLAWCLHIIFLIVLIEINICIWHVQVVDVLRGTKQKWHRDGYIFFSLIDGMCDFILDTFVQKQCLFGI